MVEKLQQQLTKTFSEALKSVGEQFIAIVPKIILALLLLALGIVFAHVAKRIALRLFDFIGLDKLSAKVNVDKAIRALGIVSSISKILSLLIYWLIVFMALLLVSEILSLQAVSDAIGAIVAYIPRLIGGLLILIIGLLVGRFLRDVFSKSLAQTGIIASDILGHIAQVVIVIFACIMALRQVGFDVTVITTNIAVILGVLLVSAGLAVALAVRPLLENFFVCQQLRQQLRPGDEIRFDDINGKVVRFSLTSVTVRSGENDIVIPARQLFEQRFSKINT
jgi:hypothetical protein